jgi:AcrR family transcriptional regulator
MSRSTHKKGEETRVDIIDAAYNLFIERGFSATSMRDISQSAGVSLSGIYNHFLTKEAIWKEVFLTRHPYREIIPLLQSAEGETIADVVHSMAQKLVGALIQHPHLFNFMFIEIVEFKAAQLPALFQAIAPDLDKLNNIFQGKQGHLRRIPTQILIRSFAGLFFSYYITGIFVKNFHGITMDETSLNQIVDIFLHGILEDEKAG